MRKLFVRLLLLFAPFIFISIFILIIDPYNLFNVSHIISDEIKIKCINRSNESIPRGNILWKMIDYNESPTPNIVLGDSRFAYISNKSIENQVEGKASNLAIPGGNYRTLIELFWMAANKTNLENVIIQADFDNYKVDGCNSLLLTPTRQVINHPVTFFFSWTYFKDALAIVYYSITKDEKFVNRGFHRTKDNWAKSTKALNKNYQLSNYKYPIGLKKELAEISKYCKKENINLFFVIAPDYYEVSQYIEKSGLADYYNLFKSDIKMIGGAKTIDLDTRTPFSYNKDNYADHFHIKIEIADTVIAMVFNDINLDKITKRGIINE